MSGLIRLMSDGLWPLINRITRENELDVFERGVLLNLISRAGRTGDAFPSQETISSDTAISLRQVQRALSSLSEMGFLTKERRGFGLGNIYHIQEDFLLKWMKDGDDSRQEDTSVTPDGRDSCATRAGVPTNRQEGRKEEGVTASKARKVSVTDSIVAEVRLEFRDLVDDVDEMLLLAKSSPTFRFAAPSDKPAVLRVLMRQRMLGQRKPIANGKLAPSPNDDARGENWLRSDEEAAANGEIIYRGEAFEEAFGQKGQST